MKRKNWIPAFAGMTEEDPFELGVSTYRTVWLPSMKKQEKLAQIVLDAKTARHESLRLLDHAKRMVEEAVLRGTQ